MDNIQSNQVIGLARAWREEKQDGYLGDPSDGKVYDWTKWVWTLKIQNKVKIFAWRACCDILPCAQTFWKRHIGGQALCSMCCKHAESTVHALWYCKNAKTIWKRTEYFGSTREKIFANFVDLLGWIWKNHSRAQVEYFMVICWFIWNRRNAKIHSNVVKEYAFLLELAAANLHSSKRLE